MSRPGQVAAVASAAAVLGVSYWYSTLDDTTSTSVAASGSTATAASNSTATPASGASAGTSTAASTGTASGTATASSGKSGSYTGSTESDKYGQLTVTVTLSSGKISDVSYTSTASDNHSLSIESQAIPTLKSEAVAANSAAIASVSGATYTSTKYKASLQSALDKA